MKKTTERVSSSSYILVVVVVVTAQSTIHTEAVVSLCTPPKNPPIRHQSASENLVTVITAKTLRGIR